MVEDQLTKRIIGCAMRVHSALGPGLLESAYVECLHFEIRKDGMEVEKQKPLPLMYQDVKLDCGYRVDLLVQRKVVVEVKSVECFNDVHLAQVLTYLKLTRCQVGLLINFNVIHLKDGIKRVILSHEVHVQPN